MSNTLVQMKSITKKFPGVLANDQVNFSVRAGEIHALLGENGSGKSTLMSILSGLYRPDEGEMLIGGKNLFFKNPRDAIAAGIGMVHQHFKLVEAFTVAENVVLGSKKINFFMRMHQVEKRLAELSASYGLGVNPTARVCDLSVGEKQRVEIVKMLYRGSKLLILDEPTAVLTPQEASELFNTIKRMTKAGHGVIIITHKMQEVMEVADRVTVLRAGKSIATLERKDVNPKKLANMMMGKEFISFAKRQQTTKGKTILDMKNVSTVGMGHRTGLTNVSLDIAAGEIMGIVGIAGNGRKELAESIVGLGNIDTGQVMLEGKDVSKQSPKELIKAGVSYVPDDRLGTGLVPALGAVDNLIMKNYSGGDLSSGFVINPQKAEAYAKELSERFGVKLTSLQAPVGRLSGGNQQRLLLARELACQPKLVVAVYPSRGLDIAATETVHKLLLEQAAQGSAVLIISEDLEEVFKICDRVGVLYRGSLMGVMPTEEATPEKIGLMMLGTTQAEVMVS